MNRAVCSRDPSRSTAQDDTVPAVTLHPGLIKALLLLLVRRHDPDVPVSHRVAVILQPDRAGVGTFGIALARRTRNLHVLVDLLAVKDRAYTRILGLLLPVATGGAERDVVRLPLLRRLTRVHVRGLDVIHRAAIAEVRLLDAVRIQHLHLVPPLQVHAAVAPRLALRVIRRLWEPELDVQLEVLELL